MQARGCRLVAVCITALGLAPIVLMSSRLGPHSLPLRIAAWAVLISCLAMSVLWMRQHWPTRAQSLICAIGGSLAIGVSALIVASPIIGFLGAANFVVLTAFVVFFHSPRLLAVTWTVVAVVVGVLFARLAPMDLALALCAMGMVVLLNAFVALAGWGMIRLIQPDSDRGDVEQLTGLLNREAFYRRAATLLASRSRSQDQYLVMVAVNIDRTSTLLGMTGSRGGNRALVAVSQALRDTVRQNAVLAHVSHADFLVADTFTTADASPLVERIRGAIASTPQRLTASIGVVSTPLLPLVSEPPDEVVDKLIAIAGTAIEQARMTGGDQVRYVLRPVLVDDEGETV
jgi:diguanylate cyclase (GGDEF)-like protein